MASARRLLPARNWFGLWLVGLLLLGLVQTAPIRPVQTQVEALRAPVTALYATQPSLIAVKPAAADTARWPFVAILPDRPAPPLAPTRVEAAATVPVWSPEPARFTAHRRARAPPSPLPAIDI